MENYSNSSLSDHDSANMSLTNKQLIDKVISTLESDNNTDTPLMVILTENILKLNPKSTAVNDAIKKIETLAEKRAEYPKDDNSNHD